MQVNREITVDVPADRAFAFFAERFDAWWPRAHKLGAADLKEAVLEPHEGGRWYELGTDGSECDWGSVLAYDPPHRLVLSWRIGGDWKIHPDQASEIEVVFTAEGDRTKVSVEHRHLERHGESAEALRDGISGDGGWSGLLRGYSDALASSASAAELMQ
jgi:uncharacterized protein YndB with AHSA1/START domain